MAIRESGKRLVEFLQAASHLILALCLLMALKAALEKKATTTDKAFVVQTQL